MSLKLATLRLFHGLSRSVQQLRTTFNDTICDILLDAIKSKDLLIVQTASSVISNTVLEFSTCRAVRILSCLHGLINRLFRDYYPVESWIFFSPFPHIRILDWRSIVFGQYEIFPIYQH